ncbi:MAG: exodeoxyribonuclease VII large subunit [Candidatus Aminicenantia bacterium]
MKLNNISLVYPDRVYTVSEVTQLIRLELESSFPLLWVDGEISNFHLHSSGHLYFTLKDESSQLKGVMFRNQAREVPFQIKDGLQVICKGRITVYPPRGEYQIVVEVLEPKGKGAFQLAFEQLKEKLKEEGLFDVKYKKPLPLLPRKIGIVTSPEGAAIVDILKILERRFAHLEILIYPVKVQGKGAAQEIVEGIHYLNTLSDIDAIIVGRGGGSVEDLWAFNEEIVARAIFQSKVPVISAVGHEIDFTIADFVADVRASTPSAAAELVVEKEEAFQERIRNLQSRTTNALKFIFQQKKNSALFLMQNQVLTNFPSRLLNLEQKVDELEIRAWKVLKDIQKKLVEKKSALALINQKIKNSMRYIIRKADAQWKNLSAQLNNLSPLGILKRGYSLCWKKDKLVLIKEARQVKVEEEVRVSFYRGEITCRVKEIDKMKKWPEIRVKNKG